MFDNVVGVVGVCSSILAGVVIAQMENPVSGWENLSAIAILGMTMYFLLTRQNVQLEKIAEAIVKQTLEIQRLKQLLINQETEETK